MGNTHTSGYTTADGRQRNASDLYPSVTKLTAATSFSPIASVDSIIRRHGQNASKQQQAAGHSETLLRSWAKPIGFVCTRFVARMMLLCHIMILNLFRRPEIGPASLLVGALLILASFIIVGGLFLLDRADLAFAPTPTPTATKAAPKSPTADFRATRVAQDMITQQANPVVIDLGYTPTAQIVVQLPAPDSATSSTTTVGSLSGQEAGQLAPSESTVVSLSLPYVPGESTPVSIIPTPSPTDPPLPTATPTPLPPTATATPIPPTPTPTITPTPLPTPYIVDRLLAQIEKPDVKRQRGPSGYYEDDGDFEIGDIWLEARSPSGEWLYASQNGNTGWLRQADAPPRDNVLPDYAPEGTKPDDVRWLAVRLPPNESGMPLVPTAIPANDFPLERKNRSNQNLGESHPAPTLHYHLARRQL